MQALALTRKELEQERSRLYELRDNTTDQASFNTLSRRIARISDLLNGSSQ